jgi:hypothetical protein
MGNPKIRIMATNDPMDWGSSGANRARLQQISPISYQPRVCVSGFETLTKLDMIAACHNSSIQSWRLCNVPK